MNFKKVISSVFVASFIFANIVTVNVSADESKTVAYWRFENTESCYSGDINGNSFAIKDLSGNGNNLKVMSQGSTTENLLKWQSDGYGGVASSLLFDNQKKYCDTSKQDTFHGGVIPVAKWFETVENAPINKEEFKNGYTIEAIIKFTPDFDFSYNRYSGIFSRQGTRLSCDLVQDDTIDNTDPLSALSVGTNTGTNADSGKISSNNKANLQFINTGFNSANNDSLDKWETNFDLVPGQWYHIAVVNDGKKNTMYLNGQVFHESTQEITGIKLGKDGYAWDIGMGRKYNTKPGSELGKDDKGTTRRPFMGQMAAIRVSSGALTKSDFLSTTNYKLPVSNNNQTPAPAETPVPTPATTDIPDATTSTPTDTPDATVSASVEPSPSVTEEKSSSPVIYIVLGILVIGGGGAAAYFIIKKKKAS